MDMLGGKASDAVARFDDADRGDATHPGVALQAVPDRVEAAVRAGLPFPAAEAFARFAVWASATGVPNNLALVARCEGLLGPAEAAEDAYRRAIALHRRGEVPLDRARTQLLLGEHLRRQRRRREAQAPLREALDTFNRIGARPWSERARAELRATGGLHAPSPPRFPGSQPLTPQETRIVSAVQQGLTNREIAARLFLSTRTVDYHLRKVFRKLNISARVQLVQLSSYHGENAAAGNAGQAQSPD